MADEAATKLRQTADELFGPHERSTDKKKAGREEAPEESRKKSGKGSEKAPKKPGRNRRENFLKKNRTASEVNVKYPRPWQQ